MECLSNHTDNRVLQFKTNGVVIVIVNWKTSLTCLMLQTSISETPVYVRIVQPMALIVSAMDLTPSRLSLQIWKSFFCSSTVARLTRLTGDRLRAHCTNVVLAIAWSLRSAWISTRRDGCLWDPLTNKAKMFVWLMLSVNCYSRCQALEHTYYTYGSA